MEGVWSAEDTTPSAIEAALRKLLQERHAESESVVPARVLNLVAVVDREWRGEVMNRLDRVGRYHPSRTVLCAVEKGRTTLDAWATMTSDGEGKDGAIILAHELVEVAIGPEHVGHLDTIVDPLVVTDLATVVWAPHGHTEAVDALMGMAQVVLLDSVEVPDAAEAIGRARNLAERAYVVDLAWLRSTPWRERIAASFDPKQWRRDLGAISGVTIRHHPGSTVAGALLLGWLSSRLGWDPGGMVGQNGTLQGRARGHRNEVSMKLEPAPELSVPGLAGLTIDTESGMSLSLDRGPGGLTARRRTRDGKESSWTVLGASRGEAGILGEGIRQALLRDPTYRPALGAACAMVG